MNCFKLVDGVFQPVEDPIDDSESGKCYTQLLYEAGYVKQFSSRFDESHEAEITLYALTRKTRPTYYIDISGCTGQIAVLVADDFPGLINVLREISPLLALIGLDQQSAIQSATAAALDAAAVRLNV